jgi:hypothetical protein
MWDRLSAQREAMGSIVAAIESGDPDLMRETFAVHQSVVRSAATDPLSGELPLCFAARLGSVEAVGQLLAAGAPVDAKGSGGAKTALQVSVPLGSIQGDGDPHPQSLGLSVCLTRR